MPPKGKGRGKAAAGHQHASTLPKGTELRDLRKKIWYLGEPIGSGGFGLIYLANDEKSSIGKDKAKFVIKVEPHGNGPLYCEVAFYQRAARQESLVAWRKSSRLSYLGIPEYVAHGLHTNGKENLRFMVMPRFGCDLHSLWLKANKRFQRPTVCQIAIELLNSLEYMHANEYVHADIKGANILLGHKDPNQIYLVDFGLAFRYLVDGKQKGYQEDPKKAHDGTIEYTSRDAHLGVAPSRRADLEILGYVLLHWLAGKLPWEDKLENKNYVKEQKIKYMKDPKQLVACVYPDAKTNKALEIEKYFQNVSNLGYDEQPNYDLLRKYFQDALKSMGISLKAKINFETDATPTPSRKRRSTQSKAKPLTSATNLQTSQSEEEEEESPKKKSRRAPRRKDVLSSSEELSSVDSAPASEKKLVKPTHAKKKNVATAKKTKPKPTSRLKKQTNHIISSEENIISDSTDENVESNDKPFTSKSLPFKKTRAKKPRSTSEDPQTSSRTEDEIDVVNSTFSVESPKKSAKDERQSDKCSMAKSRYSMAPLHTKSVLGKDDSLSGKYSGKHPVIIRRRKVKRPKTDAVTQTTPSLSKRASRV